MRVCVVGGGAAGMMAAIAAAESGLDVTLIEKNEKLGKKLFITGKGRCNVTNACSKDELMKYVIRNPRFLYSALDAFDNTDICNLIEEEGVPLKTERGDRVFPVSDHSSDIIQALKKRLSRLGVNIIYNTNVIQLKTAPDEETQKEKVVGVVTDKKKIINAEHVILTTGGCSYASTGSDGSAFEIVKTLGHEIVETRPALVPLVCSDEWIKDLQGLSLKNVEFTLKDGKKTKFNELGEMLFTHFGLSGPLVLSASSVFEKGYEAYIDLKPGLSLEKLDERLLRDFAENSNKNFDNALDGLFPKRLIPVMIELSGIDPYKKVHQVTGSERVEFGKLIKHLPVNVACTRGFEEAIITRGGVKVKEIDPSTMKSKIVDGLSFAGEMIDLDAVTGGFNLQIAWSTGYLAGSRVMW